MGISSSLSESSGIILFTGGFGGTWTDVGTGTGTGTGIVKSDIFATIIIFFF